MTTSNKKFYGVKIGKIKGVYSTWDECKDQVHGYVGATYKSFKTKEEAENYINSSKIISNTSYDIFSNISSNISSETVSSETVSSGIIKKTSCHNPDNDVFLTNYTYIFCDGSAKVHSNSEDSSGFGVCLLNKEPKNSIIYGTKIGTDSNIKGELKAIIYSLELIKKLPQHNFIIVSDSEYSLNSILIWNIHKTTKGKERMHMDLISKCKSLLKELEKLGKKILFKHVMSHKKQPPDTSSYQYFLWFGNRLADDVAGLGKSILSKNTVKLTYPTIWNLDQYHN
jgi:ribonuclease HI